MDQAASIAAHLRLSPEVARLLHGGADALEPDMVAAVLEEAARVSTEVLAPFDVTADAVGCGMADGRVTLAVGHAEAWATFRDGGWLGISAAEANGGQALPQPLASGVNEIMERGGVAFGMLPGAVRGAIRLLEAHGAPDVQAAWLPRLIAGEWAATICISESDAGSDVGRIRTRAVRDGDRWRITGEKIWISYGDHPLTERIGHLVLARPEGAVPGTRGLSLFLVPSTTENGGANGVVCRRIEHKMGLHGSPTCAMGFEDATGTLVGEAGRGLPALFAMITGMRLQVGGQGLGLATAAYCTARAYAQERRQGGDPAQPAQPIAAYPDIRRTLIDMAARIETLRGVVIAAAALADLAPADPAAEALLRFLLPIVKNEGAEAAWDICSQAVMVLGGAGYTREWPVERWLRDSRVLAVYEGTTGMQAQDLVLRRMRQEGAGFEAFAEAVRRETDSPEVLSALGRLAEAAQWLRDPMRVTGDAEAAATPLLRLATITAQGWIAARMLADEGLAPLGRAWLVTLPGRAAQLLDEAVAQPGRLAAIG